MSGATFHPVNLHPNASNLVPFDNEHMVLGNSDFTDFVALATQVKAWFTAIKTHTHPTVGQSTEVNTLDPDVGSTSVKVSL
jgi:hypothetical protein